MARKNAHASVPTGSIILSTYAALRGYVQAFAKGHINLLILVGPPGLAKSRTVRGILRDEACWIEGNATAFGMYLQLYRNRDRFVVIDDVDSLYSDRNGIRLLKCLCQTEDEKAVAWHSEARSLEKAGIPREFLTKSRVVIICNDWRTLNRNVAALQDRGHVLLFRPTAAEVHARASEWFRNEEILEWFAVNLHRIPEPSLRLYLRAAELRRAGMDWTDCLPLTPENHRKRLVMELRADSSHDTEESRVRAFVARGGGCRATYFNYARNLLRTCSLKSTLVKSCDECADSSGSMEARRKFVASGH
jgi:hypothetical protein